MKNPFRRFSQQPEAVIDPNTAVNGAIQLLATAVFTQAKSDALELFDAWWPSRAAIATRTARENPSRAISLETVHDCARSLAVSSHVHSVIAEARARLEPHDALSAAAMSDLIDQFLGTDEAKRTEDRNAVAAAGINPGALVGHFAQ